jgi:hypothetical protein
MLAPEVESVSPEVETVDLEVWKGAAGRVADRS